MEQVATMPAAKVGWAMAAKPNSKSPVWGAAAGRSFWVTATTTMKTAMKTEAKPAQVSQPIWRVVLAMPLEEFTAVMCDITHL